MSVTFQLTGCTRPYQLVQTHRRNQPIGSFSNSLSSWPNTSLLFNIAYACDCCPLLITKLYLPDILVTAVYHLYSDYDPRNLRIRVNITNHVPLKCHIKNFCMKLYLLKLVWCLSPVMGYKSSYHSLSYQD